MPDITSYGAVDRHITEYLTTDKRVKYYKCKTLQNPDYCFNGKLYTPVDTTYKANTVTSAGSISLASKGIVSVGIKNADDQYKFIGLRPDEKQDGTEQFEICPELLEINGKAQTINLSKRAAISSITTSYGNNLYVQRARQRLRIMMLADDTCESFKMTLRLYLTGLNVEYMESLDEYWIFNTDGKFRFRLGKPYLVDPETRNPLCDEFGFPYQNAVKHSLTEVSKGEYLYVKEPDKGFADIKLPKSFLIDADTVYSSSEDGDVYMSQNPGSWKGVHDATTGVAVEKTGTFCYAQSGANSGLLYFIRRGFFYYNVSALSGTVADCTENLYCVTQITGSAITAQKGTQADTLVVADYDSFTGSSYLSVPHTPTSNQYSVLTYGTQGKGDVQSAFGGVFKSCVRENRDYTDYNPGGDWNYYPKFSTSEDTSGTKDPYLYVTITAAGGSLLLPRRNFKHMIVR